MIIFLRKFSVKHMPQCVEIISDGAVLFYFIMRFSDCLWRRNLVFIYYSGVLLWHQILKRQLSPQLFIKKYWFLVGFFSLIWNISQIDVFKTKCKLKCQDDFFGKLFLKSGNTSVIFFMFSLLRFIWRTFDMIIDVQYLRL